MFYSIRELAKGPIGTFERSSGLHVAVAYWRVTVFFCDVDVWPPAPRTSFERGVAFLDFFSSALLGYYCSSNLSNLLFK